MCIGVCTCVYIVYVFMYVCMYIYQFVHNIGLPPNHDESSIMYHKSSIYVDFISKRMLLLVYSQFEIVVHVVYSLQKIYIYKKSKQTRQSSLYYIPRFRTNYLERNILVQGPTLANQYKELFSEQCSFGTFKLRVKNILLSEIT